MLKVFPAAVRGALTLLLIMVNTAVCSTPLLLFGAKVTSACAKSGLTDRNNAISRS